MARGSTLLQFEIELSDVDRNVYESLALKVAQHPSESGPYAVARVLAYALELEEGLVFTRGLAAADEPALWTRDLTGQLLGWIEVGTPDGARLHKASKAAGRVAVYCHKEPTPWLRSLARERVHGSADIKLVGLPPREVQGLAEVLERRNAWSISRIEDTLYVEAGGRSHELPLTRYPWPTED
ncbi:MAG: YaeQ family protein [Deltaproteobacteria bacterium]|nr:YaeQ family protein [Deltaproteobacteria bacterium]